MSIISIQRDTNNNISIVRMQVSDVLATVSETDYILNNQSEINALNGGTWQWFITDMILVAAEDGNAFYEFVDTSFTTIVIFGQKGTGTVNPGLQNNIPYYASNGNTLSPLSNLSNAILATNGSNVPGLTHVLPSVVQSNITAVGTIGTGIWNGSVILGQYGGTGIANVGLTINLGSATTGYVLTSDSSGNATWQMSTGSGTVSPGTANDLGFYQATGSTISPLSTAASSVLITSGLGVPSLSQTLPSAVQTNITELGTVVTGVWNGSVLLGQYGGTGIANTGLTINLGSGSTGYVLTSDSSGNGTWQLNSGSESTTYVSTTSYDVLPTDDIILMDTATIAAPSSVVLLASPTVDGKVWTIKDWSGDAGSVNITVTVSGGGLIDGSSSFVIDEAYESVSICWSLSETTYSVVYDYQTTNISGITVTGDIGTLSGSAITIFANQASVGSGSSVRFANFGSGSTLEVTDGNTNTIVGNLAGNLSITGTSNTGFGSSALSNLTSGLSNSAFGTACLTSFQNGNYNCGFGQSALQSLTSGSSNLAVGRNAGVGVLTGNFNQYFGDSAGVSHSGAESSCIYFNNAGVLSESNSLRIGVSTGTGNGQLSTAFISGINGNTLGGTPLMVVIDSSTDQLAVQSIPLSSVTFTGDTGTPFSGNAVTITGASTGLLFDASTPNLSLVGLLGSTYGGTGINSPTAHGIMIAEGASPMTPLVLGAGQILIGTTSSDPSVSAINSGTGVLVANGSGSITIGLAAIANLDILSNITGGSAAPSANSLTAIIDAAIGSTQGDILYRNSTVWTVLAPGTAGQVLESGGAAANPSWANAGASSVTFTGDSGTPFTGNAVTVTGGSTGLTFAASTPDLTLEGILDLANGGTNSNLTAIAGAITYSTASALSLTAAGTSGQLLQSAGTSTPLWTTATYPSTAGTQYNVLQSTGTNITSATLTSVIDGAFGSTQGDILYRGASDWTVLAPGTSGDFLKTNGSGANPQWSPFVTVAANYDVSSTCGTYTNTNLYTSPVNVTNLSVTLTTQGNPIYLTLIPDGTSGGSGIQSATGDTIVLFFYNGSTLIGTTELLTSSSGSITSFSIIPASSCSALDTSGAGTYTWTVKAGSVSGGTYHVSNSKLAAWELTSSGSGSGSGTVNSGTSGQVAYYASTGTAVSGESLSSLIDNSIGSTQGDILYRGASTWSVLAPGTSGEILQSGGAAANPSWVSSSGRTFVAPTKQVFLSGSGTYTTPTSPAPLYLRIRLIGGGGGGSGSGSSSSGATGGGNGNNTTFGSSFLTGSGGSGGVASNADGGRGGAGGTASGGNVSNIVGGTGTVGLFETSSLIGSASMGGNGYWGGGGCGGNQSSFTGTSGATNSGGGGGAGVTGNTTDQYGGAGGAGGFVEHLLTSSIASTYAYSVGTGGGGGSGASTGPGHGGGAGGSGQIIVEEYYQ